MRSIFPADVLLVVSVISAQLSAKKLYIGEATIKPIIISNDSHAFFETYGDAVFLTRDEVKAYLSEQEKWQGLRVRQGEAKKRPWLVLELEKIRRYEQPEKPERFVPVGGKYVSPRRKHDSVFYERYGRPVIRRPWEDPHSSSF